MVGLGTEDQSLNVLDHTEFTVVKMNALLGNCRGLRSAEAFEHRGSVRQGAGQIDVLGGVVFVLPVLMILTGKDQKRISGLHNCGMITELVQKLAAGDNEKLQVVFVGVHVGARGSPNVKGQLMLGIHHVLGRASGNAVGDVIEKLAGVADEFGCFTGLLFLYIIHIKHLRECPL